MKRITLAFPRLGTRLESSKGQDSSYGPLRPESSNGQRLRRPIASPALPPLAALAAALVGAVNVASALTPNISWRGHLLLGYEPVEAIRLFHALAWRPVRRCCWSRHIWPSGVGGPTWRRSR